MNTDPKPDELNEELMTRWIDGQLTPEESATVERALVAEPALASEKDSAMQLGRMLRQHLPASVEPPSPEFFTNRIMEEIRGTPVGTPRCEPSTRKSGLGSLLNRSWFAPLASAAAVAVLFLTWNGMRAPQSASNVARVYAPDPNVVAHSYYSEDAGATVIDLKGLEAVPDDHEVRAYDVADASPASPGRPLVLHAAAQPGRAILVVTAEPGQGPRFHELN